MSVDYILSIVRDNFDYSVGVDGKGKVLLTVDSGKVISLRVDVRGKSIAVNSFGCSWSILYDSVEDLEFLIPLYIKRVVLFLRVYLRVSYLRRSLKGLAIYSRSSSFGVYSLGFKGKKFGLFPDGYKLGEVVMDYPSEDSELLSIILKHCSDDF